ncbi:MAG: hypothetical protein ACE5JH_08470 [Acidobacteriota bacterium]
MREDRPLPPLAVGLLLAAPLVALIVWLALGGVSRRFGPATSAGTPDLATTSRRPIAGLREPDEEYPADRLHERVDGAADALRAAGCVRLLLWRTDDPPADVELLVFRSEDGAGRALQRDAGAGRTPGPGDEASVDEQAIIFRRGRFYARIYAEPGAAPDPAGLLDLARRLDAGIRAMRTGGGTGDPAGSSGAPP